ncbi:MAG: glycosyltransferase family 4 protein [Dehalococcoidia bacterium]
MRIGMIAPLEMRVPPAGYGGTELVVSLLTEELVERGHDVTLFASGDSISRATLAPGSERFLHGSGRDSRILTMLNVTACLERAGEFDIIHNHTCFEGLATAGLVSTPVLTTLHGGLAGDWLLLFKRYRGWYNAISRSALNLLPARERCAGVIYNGIDHESYTFNPNKRNGKLLFLSRMSREKGPHLAIALAKRTGRKLIMAGNVHSVDAKYFKSEVEPYIDGYLIEYVGEANQSTKRQLLSEATCLVAPIIWPEPFGLFMVEAMASGTPVVALSRGSAPEVVNHGVSGFVVATPEEMCHAIERVHEIDPWDCREHVAQNFSVQTMASNYLAAYERILDDSVVLEQSIFRSGSPSNRRGYDRWAADRRKTEQGRAGRRLVHGALAETSQGQ